MKKLSALFLALTLCLSLSATAFAAEDPIHSNGGTKKKEVTAKYAGGAAPDDVFSVDVQWGSMDFTYTDASQGKWNPQTLQYEGKGEPVWTCNSVDSKITVANRSNVAISAAFGYVPEKQYEGITGAFKKGSTESVISSVTLASAVGKEAPEQAEVNLSLSGSLAQTVTTSTKIGTVTVTVTKAAQQ